MRWTGVVVMALAVTPAWAAKVFTCTGPSGEKVFSNTPCTDAKGEPRGALYGVYEKQPDAPSKPYVPSQDANWRQRNLPTEPRMAEQVAGAERAAARAERNRASDINSVASKDPRSPLGIAARNVDVGAQYGLREQSQESDAQEAKPPVTRVGPGYTEPTIIRDQHGNEYIQPPGSAFATDQKTGKQCFVVGDTVRCD